MNRGGFSIRRVAGITAGLSGLSRRIAMPLAKTGTQRKPGALIYRIVGL